MIQTYDSRWPLIKLDFQTRGFHLSLVRGKILELVGNGEQIYYVGERLGKEAMGESVNIYYMSLTNLCVSHAVFAVAPLKIFYR